MSRCSFEKPSSLDRFLRTRSPSSSVIGRPPSSSSFESSTLAIVLLPEPLRPVKNTVKPCRARAGWLRRSSFTTSGYENQAGDLRAARQPVAELGAADVERLLVLAALRRPGSTGLHPARRPSA